MHTTDDAIVVAAAGDSGNAEAISLKGDSYRMRGRDLRRVAAANTGE